MNEEQVARAVDENSVFGRIAPAQKARIVQALRTDGHFVAMVGDGANDVQALRAADIAVAMASGTSTARGVAGIVLLSDSFEALIRGVKEADSVLGNSARLSKLFIAKSFYIYLLIVATNMLGLSFPFLPRHGGLTSLLTLGIPGSSSPSPHLRPTLVRTSRAASCDSRSPPRLRWPRQPSSCTFSSRASWAGPSRTRGP
jgi:cation-transporting ATPase E